MKRWPIFCPPRATAARRGVRIGWRWWLFGAGQAGGAVGRLGRTWARRWGSAKLPACGEFVALRLLRRWICVILPRMPKPDFSFLTYDVERQRELARKAISNAKELDKIIETIIDDSAKQALIDARDGYLDLARRLAENANTTSATATTVMSGIYLVSSSSV